MYFIDDETAEKLMFFYTHIDEQVEVDDQEDLNAMIQYIPTARM